MGTAMISENDLKFWVAYIFGVISARNTMVNVTKTTLKTKKDVDSITHSFKKRWNKLSLKITNAMLMKLFVISMVANNTLG